MIPGFNSFFKKPRYQRFHIEPRYYDPVKEEIREREERIKRELNMEVDEKRYTGGGVGIRGSFKKNARVKKDYAGLMRTMLILFITVGIFLYFTYGTVALYFLAVPVIFFYIVIRAKII